MERRTTIRLDVALLQQAKQRGLDTGRTLTAVIADALRESLARPVSVRRKMPPLPVSRHAGGTWPGVNLDSWADLLDQMERPRES